MCVCTTMAVESSWWASSNFTAALAILCDRTFWRYCRSALRHILRGISTNPKPSRNAPVTSPNVLEQAMATPRTLFLQTTPDIHSFKLPEIEQQLQKQALQPYSNPFCLRSYCNLTTAAAICFTHKCANNVFMGQETFSQILGEEEINSGGGRVHRFTNARCP